MLRGFFGFSGLTSLLLIVSTPHAACAQSCGPTWSTRFADARFDGAPGSVSAIKEFNDGSGLRLWIAGGFVSAWPSSGPARQGAGVAAWDGTTWVDVGRGIDGTWLDLEVFDDGNGPALYAAGWFRETAGPNTGVRRWNGAGWESIAGPDGRTDDLQVYDDGTGSALYAVGNFVTCGSVSVTGIARYRNGAWSAVGSLDARSGMTMTALTTGASPGLYVGGIFAGSTSCVRWFAGAWTNAGVSGQGGQTIHLGTFNGALLAGQWTLGLWRRDPASLAWQQVAGMDASIPGNVQDTLAFDDGRGLGLFCGGSFRTAGVNPLLNLARWTGSTWTAVAPTGWANNGLGNGAIGALGSQSASPRPNLVFGGTFEGADPDGNTENGIQLRLNSVGVWTGSQFRPLGLGVTHSGVRAIAFDPGETPLVGGDFRSINGAGYRGVASFQNEQWAMLGGEFNGQVSDLVYFEGVPIAAGAFTRIGGNAVRAVARFQSGAWQSMPGGIVRPTALESGGFNGVPSLFIADGSTQAVLQWNGTTFVRLGSTSPSVTSDDLLIIEEDGVSKLVVPSRFQAFANSGNRTVGIWDGTAWSYRGVRNTLQSTIRAVAWFDDGTGPKLYASGIFQDVSPFATGDLAVLENDRWRILTANSPLNSVGELAVFDDGYGPSLYGVGAFAIGGRSESVARWNGQQWVPLGSGIGGSAAAVLPLVEGGVPKLLVAGSFSHPGAGGTGVGLAEWVGCSFCPADFDRSGEVGGDDVVGFFAEWDNGGRRADFDTSGGVDSDDVIAFFQRWNEGC